MTVWISKYALTKGIFQLEVKSTSEDGNAVYGKGWEDAYHGKGKEWHETKEQAVIRAEEMRKKKIASLQKQISRLEKLKF